MTSGHSHPVEVEAKYWGRFMHPCSIGVFSVRFKMKTLIHFQGGGQKRFCCHEVISLSISVVDSKCFFPSCSVFNSTASRADFSFIFGPKLHSTSLFKETAPTFFVANVHAWSLVGKLRLITTLGVVLGDTTWKAELNVCPSTWSDNKKIIKNSRVTTSLSSLWVWAQIVWLV